MGYDLRSVNLSAQDKNEPGAKNRFLFLAPGSFFRDPIRVVVVEEMGVNTNDNPKRESTMKRYIAEKETSTMMYAAMVYCGVLALGEVFLAIEGVSGSNAVLMIVLAICGLVGARSAMILAKRRELWIELDESVLRVGHRKHHTTLAYEEMRAVKVKRYGRALEVATRDGEHEFDICVDEVQGFLEALCEKLEGRRCAIDFESFEQAFRAIEERERPPTARRVFASAILGGLVMGATYLGFVMLLPYLM